MMTSWLASSWVVEPHFKGISGFAASLDDNTWSGPFMNGLILTKGPSEDDEKNMGSKAACFHSVDSISTADTTQNKVYNEFLREHEVERGKLFCLLTKNDPNPSKNGNILERSNEVGSRHRSEENWLLMISSDQGSIRICLLPASFLISFDIIMRHSFITTSSSWFDMLISVNIPHRKFQLCKEEYYLVSSQKRWLQRKSAVYATHLSVSLIGLA